jgi:hypothetical protein
MKQNFGGKKFKGDREMEKGVTQRLISHDITSVKRKQKNLLRVWENALVAVLWYSYVVTYISEEYIAFIQPEVCGFNYQWCNWNVSLTQSSLSHYGPGIESASKRNESQQYFRCVRLTSLSLLCVDFYVNCEPRPLGTLKACPGLYRNCFNFLCCL